MKTLTACSKFSWQSELQHTLLPHEGYRDNFVGMCERLELNNQLSFSAACGSSIRKSANRLFSSMDFDIQSGHIEQTALRCKRESVVFVLEDTTDANYKTHPQTEGLGDLGGYGIKKLKPGEKRNAGLSIHTAFAITPQKAPLGILGQHIWAPVNAKRKSALLAKLPIEKKESYKWHLCLDWVKNALANTSTQVYVIGDREGDFYEHFTKERPRNVELIMRVLHKHRKVIYQGVEQTVKQILPKLTYRCEREVHISARKGQKERTASLKVYSGEIVIPPPYGKKGESIKLSIVWSIEQNPQDGFEALDWVIFSTKPVKTTEDAVFVLDSYTKRWTIERFHYVLKQGLRIERLQFDNFSRLTNAIRVCSMIAWRLLDIAYLSKTHPEGIATEHFEIEDVSLLEKATSLKITTVKDYILSLGKLVGFVSSTKQPYPGEKLLWQASQILAMMRRGADLTKGDFYGTG